MSGITVPMKPIAQELTVINKTTTAGMPDGGSIVCYADTPEPCLLVRWQQGSLVDPATGTELVPNGLFLATLVRAAISRLSYYQHETPFACAENAEALEHLQQALNKLDSRAIRRAIEGTLGTHDVDQNPNAQ